MRVEMQYLEGLKRRSLLDITGETPSVLFNKFNPVCIARHEIVSVHFMLEVGDIYFWGLPAGHVEFIDRPVSQEFQLPVSGVITKIPEDGLELSCDDYGKYAKNIEIIELSELIESGIVDHKDPNLYKFKVRAPVTGTVTAKRAGACETSVGRFWNHRFSFSSNSGHHFLYGDCPTIDAFVDKDTPVKVGETIAVTVLRSHLEFVVSSEKKIT